MQIAVDMSLYPLNGEYIPPIKDFIARLSRHPGLTFEYNSLSTQVRGEFDVVLDAIRSEMRGTFEGPDRAVFVMKVIGGATPATG